MMSSVAQLCRPGRVLLVQHYRAAATKTTSLPEQNYLMTQAARLEEVCKQPKITPLNRNRCLESIDACSEITGQSAGSRPPTCR